MFAGVLGQELVDASKEMASSEAQWLAKLASFDRSLEWQHDGQLSCATWVAYKCSVGRSTAKEKLRVAHELERRPIVAAAFEAGDITYSKARILTRLFELNDERD